MVFDLLINLLMSRHLIMTWLGVRSWCSMVAKGAATRRLTWLVRPPARRVVTTRTSSSCARSGSAARTTAAACAAAARRPAGATNAFTCVTLLGHVFAVFEYSIFSDSFVKLISRRGFGFLISPDDSSGRFPNTEIVFSTCNFVRQYSSTKNLTNLSL